jgi:hypothetical protein
MIHDGDQPEPAVKRANDERAGPADTAAVGAGIGPRSGKGTPIGGVAAAIPPNTNKVEERDMLPFFDTGSTMMDEILEHSLARLLEAVEGLEAKVEMKGGHAPDGTPVK